MWGVFFTDKQGKPMNTASWLGDPHPRWSPPFLPSPVSPFLCREVPIGVPDKGGLRGSEASRAGSASGEQEAAGGLPTRLLPPRA